MQLFYRNSVPTNGIDLLKLPVRFQGTKKAVIYILHSKIRSTFCNSVTRPARPRNAACVVKKNRWQQRFPKLDFYLEHGADDRNEWNWIRRWEMYRPAWGANMLVSLQFGFLCKMSFIVLMLDENTGSHTDVNAVYLSCVPQIYSLIKWRRWSETSVLCSY